MRASISRTLRNIGFANLLWNKVEMLWYLYFTTLLPGIERKQIDAIYRSHDTGNKKRLLIVAIALQRFPAESPDIARIRVLMGRTTEAAKKRNSLMHADFTISMEDGVSDLGISPGGDHSKPNSLASAALHDELTEYLATLKALIRDVEYLLRGPSEESSLDRPDDFPVILTTARFVDIVEDILVSDDWQAVEISLLGR